MSENNPLGKGLGDFMVYAVDIDGTALEHPDKVNNLCSHPFAIVILHTARPESERARTVAQLQEKGIQYHSLRMDKLRADVYIDDRNYGGLRWPDEARTPFVFPEPVAEKEEKKEKTSKTPKKRKPALKNRCCENCAHTFVSALQEPCLSCAAGCGGSWSNWEWKSAP